MNVYILIFIIIFMSTLVYYISHTYESQENFDNATKKGSMRFLKNYKKFLNKRIKSKVKNPIDVPVFYINLDSSKDRNENMIRQFKKYNVNDYTRIPAINGKEFLSMNEDIFTVMGDPTTYKFVNSSSTTEPSYIGCDLSHLYAAKVIVDNNLPYALVLEDDMDLGLTKVWDKSLSGIISEYESMIKKDSGKEFDILKISNLACNTMSKTYVRDNVDNRCYSTTAMVYSLNGAKKLLKKAFSNITNTFYIMDIPGEKSHADHFIFSLVDNTFNIIPSILVPYMDKPASTVGNDLHYQNYCLDKLMNKHYSNYIL